MSMQLDTEQALEKAHTAHLVENVLDELHSMCCTEWDRAQSNLFKRKVTLPMAGGIELDDL